MSARIAAWVCLRRGGDTPLRDVDAVCAEFELDARDRGLVRHLVGTELRRRGTLRAIVKRLSRLAPKPDLAAHLRLGVAQLLFSDKVPDHAAVSETLDAVRHTLGGSKVKYANGLLRNVARMRRDGACGDPRHDLPGRDAHLVEPMFRNPQLHPLLWVEDALSIPSQLGGRWQKRHGTEGLFALGRLALEEPPLALRVARGTRDEARAALAAAGVDATEGEHPSILFAPADATRAVTETEAFRSGALTVQGAHALAAAELVQARADEDVLDLCAAPGGKTAVLAASGARVTACDVAEGRLDRTRETLERLGVAEHVRLVAGDGTAGLDDDATFDAALVDAPCSNTAVLAARPAARWRFGKKTLADLASLQGRLLAEAAARVRPGGRLVWSTCSLEPEENGQRVRAFLDANPGWSLDEERETLPGAPPAAVDGGYAARLLRDR